jgi:D-cysteine desulfhydrase
MALPRLQEEIGGVPILAKRDDLAGFAIAGAKARALEHLIGHALAEGFDAIVTGGAAGSNFCQGAAVAASMAGLDCHLLMAGEPGGPQGPSTPNLALAQACGARVHWTGGPREQVDDEIRAQAAELTRHGRPALAVPRGGADPVGCRGFMQAADELSEQLAALGHTEVRVVLAVGSGGSVAGLLVGIARRRLPWTVTGVSVSRPLDALAEHMSALAAACASGVGVALPDLSALTLVPTRGRPHGPAAPDELDAAGLLLRSEGLVMDADYTARAALVAAEVSRVPGPPVVLWHTGGLVRAVSDLAGQGPRDSTDAAGAAVDETTLDRSTG